MSTHQYVPVVLCLIAGAAGAAFAGPSAHYTATEQLRDGKQVTCAVNEPGAAPASGAPTLTTSERNEAEIAATAILRRQAGNRNAYPTPSTAPHVLCW